MIVLTGASAGCAAEQPEPPPAAAEAENVSTKATPFVGTWRWSGSGGRIGDIDLGEEQFVFRDDGTYVVASKSGDGTSECYEGTFTWAAAAEPDRGTIVFRSSHFRDTQAGFERDVYLDGTDTLHFGEGGTYRRSEPVLAVRCP